MLEPPVLTVVNQDFDATVRMKVRLGDRFVVLPGPRRWRRNPTLVAPGDDVVVRGQTVDGTSYAAPLVTSTIALLKQADPKLTSDQILDLLTTTATDTPADARSEGAGVLDPAAALARALQLAQRRGGPR